MAFVVRVASNSIPSRLKRLVIDPANTVDLETMSARAWALVYPDEETPASVVFAHIDGKKISVICFVMFIRRSIQSQ